MQPPEITQARSHRAFRAAAIAAASTVGLAALAVTPAQAAVPDPHPARSGASWLVGELTNGLIVNEDPQFGGFTDIGLTIDVAMGLDTIGTADPSIQTIANAVAPQASGYTRPGFGTSVSAGGTAKTLVLTQVAGQNGAAYGGLNLITQLEGTVTTTGVSAGRIADTLDPTYVPGTGEDPPADYANVIGQTLAARGLAQAASTRAPAVTSFLLKQQCSEGYFREYFTADKAAADQTCDGGKASGASAASVDTTAYAVLQLQGQRADPTVTAALAKATSWLKTQQAADGSFKGVGATAVPNTNSTGLAASALGTSCQVDAARKAAGWISDRQVLGTSYAGTPLAAEQGAIAYDPAALTAGRTSGITAAKSDQWRRATSQGAPALIWARNSTSLLGITAPGGFVKAGSKVSVTITGAALGETVCFKDPGTTTTLVGTGQPLVAKTTVPKKSFIAAFTATSGPGNARDTVRVLGRKTVPLSLKKPQVVRGFRQVAKVTGLAPGETVKIFYRGLKVAEGTANKKGKFTGRFKVTGKPGFAKVRVKGQYSFRKNAAAFRVQR